jgi:putative sigma-54 modulation protein
MGVPAAPAEARDAGGGPLTSVAEAAEARSEIIYTAQMTTWADHAILRAEEMNEDLFAAIDLAADKLFRQIERFKGKRLARRHEPRRAAAAGDAVAVATEIGLGEDEPVIVRRKRFPVAPMSEQEAVDQLELLGHDFFLFQNVATGGVNVLYRRKDGHLGLIEPERS